MDHSSIMMITNQEDKILEVNDQFIAISGYSREESINIDQSILHSHNHSIIFLVSGERL